MTQPRSNNNAYMSREYSYQTQTMKDLPVSDGQYFDSDHDVLWQNNGTRSGTMAVSPRLSTRLHANSINTSTNVRNTIPYPQSFVVNESDLSWHQNAELSLSPKMKMTVANTPSIVSSIHNLHSSSVLHNVVDSKDQFSIYGSFKKQITERTDNISRYESQKAYDDQSDKLMTLPTKQQTTSTVSVENISKNYSSYDRRSDLDSQGLVTPQTVSRTNQAPIETPVPIIEDEMVPMKTLQVQSSLPNTEDPNQQTMAKDQQIKKLNKKLMKCTKNMKDLQQNNEELQTHLRNLLNERKNLIRQIENTDYEEIIEEEEVQKAKPNYSPNNNVNRKISLVTKEENLIEKSKLTIRDLPAHVINNYRREIMDQEREKMEIEKRALLETLNIQHQQQLQTLKKQEEMRKKSVTSVSVQSYKNTKFNQILSDVHINEIVPVPRIVTRGIVTTTQPLMAHKQSQNEISDEVNKKISKDTLTLLNQRIRNSQIKTTKWQNVVIERLTKSLESNDPETLSSVIGELLFKPSKSVEITAQPTMTSRQTQNEIVVEKNTKTAKETLTRFNKIIRESKITSTPFQNSVLDRFAKSLETNDSESLFSLIQELLFKPSNSIGINCTQLNWNKSMQTDSTNYNNLSYEVNLVQEKRPVEKSSKSIEAIPNLIHKGSQPEERFQFETGTMTDHLFYRSQGVNTLVDYSKQIASPQSETESYVTKSSTKSEMKKQIKSQTTITKSPSNTLPILNDKSMKIEIKNIENVRNVQPVSNHSEENLQQTFITKEVRKPEQTSINISKSEVVEPILVNKSINQSAANPPQITEEWRQTIAKNTQVITAHLDRDQKLKDESKTTVECWEAISKFKDGKLIENKESSHDKYIVSNPEEILKQIDSRRLGHDQSTEFVVKSPESLENSTINVKKIPIFTSLSKSSVEKSDSQLVTNETYISPIQTKLTEASFSQKSSSSIPITRESVVHKSQKTSSGIPLHMTKHESSSFENHSSSMSEKHMIKSGKTETNSTIKPFAKTSTIGSISSPTSFRSFSFLSNNSMNRSNTASKDSFESESMSLENNTERQFSDFNSKQKFISKPIQIQSSKSSSFEIKHDIKGESAHISPLMQMSRMHINTNNGSGSNSGFGSEYSAFYSISEQNRPAVTTGSGSQEVLLPENIFQYSSQVLLWLNSNNHVCITNLEHMPKEMIDCSEILIDWWVDTVTKLNPSQLMTTIQYLMVTFSKKFVKFLIINRDQQGNTCLHYIVGNQLWETFTVLHSTGLVDPDVYNEQGFTVMMIAATLQVSNEILRQNIRKLALTANLNLISKDGGQTATFLAALHDNDNTIAMLYTLGADINLRDRDDNTPLMIGVQKNNVKAVSAILSCPNVLLDIKNKEGLTALNIAQINNFPQIIELFDQRKSLRRSEMSPKSPTTDAKFL